MTTGDAADTQDRLERAICQLVLAALEAEGRSARLLGRPDREDRTGPGADFLLSVDGRETALEVTRTAATEQQRTAQLNQRLGNRLLAILGAEVEAARIGHAFVTFNLALRGGLPPRQRAVDQAAVAIAEQLRAAIPRATRTGERLQLATNDIVDELTLRVSPTKAHRLTVVWGADATFPAAAAGLVARRVIRSKSRQLAAYERAYLALLEPTLLIEPEHLSAAFASEKDDIPPNWLRIYVVTREKPVRADLVFARL